MIINLFCDASINTTLKIACAGCVTVFQDNSLVDGSGFDRLELRGRKALIQHDATNNSAEILAIWIGVVEALHLRSRYPFATFRLFSDSKISLYGMRDWIRSWILKMEEEGSDTLITSSGSPVMNQQTFIDIFNLIVENNLKIEFYHQRGHVGYGPNQVFKARSDFIKANKVMPENMGIRMSDLCKFNNMVDDYTRLIVTDYVDKKFTLPNSPDVGIAYATPMDFVIRKDQLINYCRLINRTSVGNRKDSVNFGGRNDGTEY